MTGQSAMDGILPFRRSHLEQSLWCLSRQKTRKNSMWCLSAELLRPFSGTWHLIATCLQQCGEFDFRRSQWHFKQRSLQILLLASLKSAVGLFGVAPSLSPLVCLPPSKAHSTVTNVLMASDFSSKMSTQTCAAKFLGSLQ